MRSRSPRATFVALAVSLLLPSIAPAQGARPRNYGATRTAVTIDGATVMVDAAEGGVAVADVIAAQAGPDGTAKKHIGNVRYEDLKLDVGLDATPILEWVAQSWEGKAQPKTLTVVTADATMKAQSERQIANAMVAETTFPALDAAAREQGRLTVSIVPQGVETRRGSGAPVGGVGPKQRAWLTSSFRLELDGIDAARITRIEPFTVGRRPMGDMVGAVREPVRPLGALHVPNLTVTFSQASERSWSEWHDRFVVKGENGDAAEKNGAIVLLSPDARTELARVVLSNCGIVRLAPAADAAPSAAARMTAELYCEGMRLQLGK